MLLPPNERKYLEHVRVEASRYFTPTDYWVERTTNSLVSRGLNPLDFCLTEHNMYDTDKGQYYIMYRWTKKGDIKDGKAV